MMDKLNSVNLLELALLGLKTRIAANQDLVVKADKYGDFAMPNSFEGALLTEIPLKGKAQDTPLKDRLNEQIKLDITLGRKLAIGLEAFKAVPSEEWKSETISTLVLS